MSTKLTINRTNGNVPKSLPGEDHISGFIAYLTDLELPTQFKENHVQALSTIEAAEKAGIKADSSHWAVKVLHYHLSEIYRINPAITLYVGLFVKPSSSYTFAEVKTVQNFAGGRIRQMAIWLGDKNTSADDITTLQGIGNKLSEEAAELSILYAPRVENLNAINMNVATAGNCRVSTVICQAGSGKGAELYNENNSRRNSVSSIGTVLGLLSRAKVHQSIAWVKEFPTGISVPAFSDGTLLRDVDKALVEQLDTARYLFFITHPGQSGSYMNDSHTMDVLTSDYSAIENVRTMDKAVRGIRKYIVPELGGNVYIDAESGKLASYSVENLITIANLALEDMERAGELSGYKADIDPNQDVAKNGTIEIVIKNVASPVIRHINIKIGFAKSI